LLSATTLSVNMIGGDFQINVVPDLCRATIDIRTVPSQDRGDVVALLQALVDEVAATVPDFRATLSVRDEAAPRGDASGAPVPVAKRAVILALGEERPLRGVDYFSDASVLHPPTGVPTIVFGPGDDRLAHQVDESVAVKAIIKASRVFAALPLELFAHALVGAEIGLWGRVNSVLGLGGGSQTSIRAPIPLIPRNWSLFWWFCHLVLR
jgi:succinyl-diaminopimelate desuccinylase